MSEVIDPLQRWREFGEKPDFAGLPSLGGAPYTEDPAELVEVIPTAVGSADVTALATERVVREILTGIALRRRA